MRLLITGALGHIGSRLIRDLPVAFPGCEIIMIDNLLTQRYCSLFNLPQSVHYQFIEADVRSIDLRPIVSSVDAVIHLAAITEASASFANPELVEDNNLAATHAVANSCADCEKPLIALSSTSVYGTNSLDVSEDCLPSELQPQSPYAATKLKEEDLIMHLVRDRGLDSCILRFGTIFGTSPGMRFHTAVNKFCWQAAMGAPITVWKTAANQIRPYLEIRDASASLCHVLRARLYAGSTYNVVTVNVTVNDIVDAIRHYLPETRVDLIDSDVMNTFSYLVSDAKIKSTGYKPVGNLLASVRQELSMLCNWL